MKRFLGAAIVVCGLIAVAYAQSTKTALQTQIANCFPTQTVGAITPPITVTCMNAIIASMQQYAGVNAQTTTSYTVLQSDYGQLVTFNNTGAISATLPQPISSAFYPFNVFLKNVGTGAVNLLPVGSTVNSATTLQLTTGQSVWLVSDNANWQAWNAGSSGGPIVSVASSDGSLNIAPTVGSVLASINTSHVNTWLNSQIFSNNTLGLGGPTAGVTSLQTANNTATSNTITIPGFVGDSLVTNAASATLTNKTIITPTINGPIIVNATTASQVSLSGQLIISFGTPTAVSAHCGGGGVNATLATSSTNQSGQLNIAGNTSQACTVAFSQTLTSTPIACVFVPASVPAATWQLSSVYMAAVTNSAFVLAGNQLQSTNWYYHCY